MQGAALAMLMGAENAPVGSGCTDCPGAAGALCCTASMNVPLPVFFAVIFAAYFSIQAYLFARGWRALEGRRGWRPVYAVVFWFAALAFIVGRNLENVAVTPLSTALVWVGAFWFALMYYLFLSTLALDIGAGVLRRMRLLPASWADNRATMRFRAALGVVFVAAVLVAWGHWNALHPEVVRMEVSLPARGGAPPELRAVVASDWHLGTLVTQERVRGWVETINALRPDIILLPGDIIDEDLPPVVENNLGESLRNLRAPLGVYAVTGNHEFIGGVEAAVRYLREHGVRVLRDEAVPVAGGAFWLAGREDAGIARLSGHGRAPLRKILCDVPSGAPVVVMDHRPIALDEASADGAAVQVSGHTHDGQLWPNKYLVRALLGVDSGPGVAGAMAAYILPGLGTWGPPVRVGNRPQILVLTLKFDLPFPDQAGVPGVF